jgi:hypothetical protein
MEYLEHDLLIDSVLLVLIEHLAIIECKVLVLLLPLLRVQHLNQDVLYHRLNTINNNVLLPRTYFIQINKTSSSR